MEGFINSINFAELEVQKYWQPPASWTNERKKQEIHNRIFSGNWLGSQKRDGALYAFLKDEDGNISLRGRSKSVSGEYLDKWDHVPHIHDWANQIPNGTFFLGELYISGKEGSKNTSAIMNCLTARAVERQKDNNLKLHYYIFDCLAWNGESYLNKTAAERFSFLDSLPAADYVETAKYYRGEELWEQLQILLAEGYEGIVITKDDSTYEPGKRPSKTTMKVKQEIKETIDCIVMGANPPTKEYTGKNLEGWRYYYNEVTNERLPEASYYQEYMNGEPIVPVTKNYYKGFAGSLRMGLVDGNKVTFFCDVSGLSEEILFNWKDYKGKIAEIGGMMISRDKDGNYSIRHPKFLGFRNDKLLEDCTWSQVIER